MTLQHTADERALAASALFMHPESPGDAANLSSFLESLPGCAYRCPLHNPVPGVVVNEHVSEGVSDISGYSAEDFWEGRVAWSDLIHPEDLVTLQVQVGEAVAARRRYSVTYRIRHKSGRTIWVLDRGRPAIGKNGAPLWLEGFVSDITEQKETEAALRDSEEQLRAMLNAQPECVMVVSLHGCLVNINPAGLAMIGSDLPADVIGRNVLDFIDPDHHDTVRELHAQAVRGYLDEVPCEIDIMSLSGRTRRAEVRLAPLHAADGTMWGVLSVARDITDRKRAEERMEWLATHDPLTALPNRALFQQRLQKATEAGPGGPGAGVLIIDLDNFKQVNDTMGHDAGDALLCETARRLREHGQAGWTVARLGGDEFAMILPGMQDRNMLAEAVKTILAKLREPVTFAGKVLDSRASIGATLYPEDDHAPADLLKNADIALYAAKAAGRGRAVHYTPEMRHEIQQRVATARRFKAALAEDRVIPYYQPKIDLTDGSLSGFEALLRWRGEDGEIHRPGSAASAFEDTELAVAISNRMIGKVLGDMRAWLDAGLPFGHVAVNVSALEFRQPDFAARLMDSLAEHAIPAERLQVEVTETVFLGQGSEGVEQALKALSASGIRIALDDFGTGYASLSHLKRFPVDILKIDQTFIHDLAQEGDDASIVSAVITLGHNLGMKVVAEGVEDLRQAAYLRKQGCDVGQGYLFGAPAAAEKVASDPFWAQQGRDRARWSDILTALSSPAVAELPRRKNRRG
ncbi:MAG TPA: EAL domain-containing protein [Allosphingosinicella sp.]